MNTNEINKELHALLGLEWHEIHFISPRFKWECSCNKKLFTPEEVKEHRGLNHTFASDNQKESDAGRVELLRIMEGRNWCDFVEFIREPMEYGYVHLVAYLTEISGEHKLCNAVIEFLKEREGK